MRMTMISRTATREMLMGRPFLGDTTIALFPRLTRCIHGEGDRNRTRVKPG